FLGVGLDQAADVILRRTANTNSANSAKGTNSNPLAKLTPAEKRALAGALPALMSYFEIVQHTKGLESLLMKLIDRPSLWSVIRHRGVSVGVFFRHAAYAANPSD